MNESANHGESERLWHFGPIEWKPVLSHTVPVSLFILGLFYYWFAVADRYAIFLYGHLGATPFDDVTGSRYWMAGLVACGVVMVGYSIVNGLLGRIAVLRHLPYSPPAWWQVWTLCVMPLSIGIPAITMALNWPTLPLSHAAACVVVTLIGLALALMPGSWAAQRPFDLSWLVFDRIGLMPSLLLLRAIELPGRGLISARMAYMVALGSTFAGAVWLGIMTGLRAWQYKSAPETSTLFVAGLCLSYLWMPLVHYLLFTPSEYRYISTAGNFFASNAGVQLVSFFVAAGLAIGITQLRRRLERPRHLSCARQLRLG